MEAKHVAGLGLLLGAVAGGIYAYREGWFSKSGPVGQLNSRKQALKWMGEQLRYKGQDVDVHQFVHGATGLTSQLQDHLGRAIDLKKVKHSYQHVGADGIGRPW